MKSTAYLFSTLSLALAWPVMGQDFADRSADGTQQLENQLSLNNDRKIDLWSTSVTVGLSVSSGNIESSLIYADIQTRRQWGAYEALLGLGGTYGESESVTTSDYQFGYLQLNRALTDRFYFGVKGYGIRDAVADLDYRFSLGPVWGVYLIKTDTTTLKVEAGPAYTWEKQGGLRDDYVSVLVSERFEHQFTERLRLWQALEWRPAIDDFNDYTLNAEIGIEARMTEHLSLKTFLRNIHDSTPAPGFKKDDLAWITALTYSFGGDPLDLSDSTTNKRFEAGNAADLAGAAEGNVTTAALGATLNSGNTDSLAITADLFGVRRSGDREFYFGASATYGEFDDEDGTKVTDQNIFALLQYNYLFADPWFLGIHSDIYHDKLADLDYRWTTSPTLGLYLHRDPYTTLSVEAGPAYIREKQDGTTTDSLGLFAQEKFTHRFNDVFHIWQSLSYSAPFNEMEDYILRGEIGGAVDLGRGYSWRTSFEDVYTNRPAVGRKRNDMRLKTAVAYSF